MNGTSVECWGSVQQFELDQDGRAIRERHWLLGWQPYLASGRRAKCEGCARCTSHEAAVVSDVDPHNLAFGAHELVNIKGINVLGKLANPDSEFGPGAPAAVVPGGSGLVVTVSMGMATGGEGTTDAAVTTPWGTIATLGHTGKGRED